MNELLDEWASLQLEASQELKLSDFGWQNSDWVVRQIQIDKFLNEPDLGWDRGDHVVVEGERGELGESSNSCRDGFQLVEGELEFDKLGEVGD